MSWGRYGGATPPVKVTLRWRAQDYVSDEHGRRIKRGFLNFLMDVGYPPSLIHTLDRKRRTGPSHYVASNVRWATPEEQSRNRRNSILITLPDPRFQHLADHERESEVEPSYDTYNQHAPVVTLCAKEWAKLVGLGYSTLLGRLRRGWPHLRAVMTPVQSSEVPF